MSSKNKVARSAVLLIFFSLISKILGFVRETLIAYRFGLGSTTDAYFIAFSATSLLSGFIMTSLNTTFIPIISEVEEKEGKIGKINHTNNMINIMFLISTIIMIGTYILSPYLVKLLASGFDTAQLKLATELTRIGLPMIIINSLVGVYSGYLQSEGLFFSTAIKCIPFNFIYILYLITISKNYGIKGLMFFSVIGTFSTFLIQLPELKSSGYTYENNIDFKDTYIKKMLFLSLPAFISVAINDLNVIIDKRIASKLAVGSVSALNYANKLNTLILGLFIAAITTVIFPSFSEYASKNDTKRLKEILSTGVNIVLIITIPATIGMMVLNYPIVKIAFERGQFDNLATQMTSNALLFYSIGLVFSSLRLIYEKVFFSLQNTRTPMITGGLAVLFNIILNLILVKKLGHGGLALATSLSIILSTIILIYFLRKTIGPLGLKQNIICGFKCLVSSLIMGVAANFLYGKFVLIFNNIKYFEILSLLLSVGISIVIYLGLIYFLKVDEIVHISEKIEELMIKRKN